MAVEFSSENLALFWGAFGQPDRQDQPSAEALLAYTETRTASFYSEAEVTLFDLALGRLYQLTQTELPGFPATPGIGHPLTANLTSPNIFSLAWYNALPAHILYVPTISTSKGKSKIVLMQSAEEDIAVIAADPHQDRRELSFIPFPNENRFDEALKRAIRTKNVKSMHQSLTDRLGTPMHSDPALAQRIWGLHITEEGQPRPRILFQASQGDEIASELVLEDQSIWVSMAGVEKRFHILRPPLISETKKKHSPVVPQKVAPPEDVSPKKIEEIPKGKPLLEVIILHFKRDQKLSEWFEACDQLFPIRMKFSANETRREFWIQKTPGTAQIQWGKNAAPLNYTLHFENGQAILDSEEYLGDSLILARVEGRGIEIRFARAPIHQQALGEILKGESPNPVWPRLATDAELETMRPQIEEKKPAKAKTKEEPKWMVHTDVLTFPTKIKKGAAPVVEVKIETRTLGPEVKKYITSILVRGRPMESPTPVTFPISLSENTLPLTLTAFVESKNPAGWEKFSIEIDPTLQLKVEKGFLALSSAVKAQAWALVWFGTMRWDSTFNFVFTLLDHPIKGKRITSIELKLDKRLARLFPDMAPSFQKEFDLSASNGADHTVTLDLNGVGEIVLDLHVGNETLLVDRRPNQAPVWDAIDLSKDRPTLVGLVNRGFEAYLEFALEIYGTKNKRGFIHADDLPKFLGWMDILGHPVTIQNGDGIEVVLDQKGEVQGFIPIPLMGERPIRAVAMDHPSMILLDAATNPPLLQAAQGNSEELYLGAPHPFSKPSLSALSRFSHGEALLPHPMLLDQLVAYSTFEEDRDYFYEMDSPLRGLIFRFPVRFRPDRKTNVWELQADQPVLVRRTHEDVSEVVSFPKDYVLMDDNGGNWRIHFFDPSKEEPKVGELRAVFIGSPYVISMAYVASKGEESLSAIQLHVKIKTVLRLRDVWGEKKDWPRHQVFSSGTVQRNSDRSLTLVYRLKEGDESEWLSLTGIHKNRWGYDFDRELELRFYREGKEVLVWPMLLHPHPEIENAYRLQHLRKIGLGILVDGKVPPPPLVDWFPELGQMILRSPDQPSVEVNLDALFASQRLPTDKTFEVIKKDPEARAHVVDYDQIPILPEKYQAYVLPNPGEVQSPRDSRHLKTLLDQISHEVFVPDRDSTISLLVAGGDSIPLVAVAPSGSALVVPIQRDSKESDRTLLNIEANAGARLLVQMSDGLFEVPVRLESVESQTGFRLVILSEDHPILAIKLFPLDRIHTLSQKRFFALADEEGSTSSPAQIRQGLKDWLDVLKFQKDSIPLNVVHGDGYYDLPDGTRLFFSIREKRANEFYLDGLGDSSQTISYQRGDEKGHMRIDRSPRGLPIFEIHDEKDRGYLLMISDDGKLVRKGQPLFWNLPELEEVRGILFPPDSEKFSMVGMKGQTYSDPSVITRVGRFGLRGVLGREKGGSDRSTMRGAETESAFVEFEAREVNGQIVVGQAHIKELGKGKTWQAAETYVEEDPNGCVRVYLMGRELRKGGRRDFAWIEFEGREGLLAPKPKILRAHYNRTNQTSNRFPDQDSPTSLITGIAAYDPELGNRMERKKPKPPRSDLEPPLIPQAFGMSGSGGTKNILGGPIHGNTALRFAPVIQSMEHNLLRIMRSQLQNPFFSPKKSRLPFQRGIRMFQAFRNVLR